MGARHRWWWGVLITGATVGGVFWALPYFGVPTSDGPMAPANPHSSALDDFTVGDRFTYGLNTLTLDGSATAAIRHVRVVGLDDGVRLLGARLGGPDRSLGSWQVLPSWPPRQRGADLRSLSTPITSRSADPMGWELFIGLEVTKPGRFISDGWEITYEVGHRTYRYTIPARILICTRHDDQPAPNCLPPDPT